MDTKGFSIVFNLLEAELSGNALILTSFRSGVQWELLELVRALSIGILVQAASNVSNTYWDFVNGKDAPIKEDEKPSGPVMAHKNVLTSGI